MLYAAVLALLWIQAQPAAQADARPTAMIVGRVLDAASGVPVPGVTVSLFGGHIRGAEPPKLMTDPQGRFIYRNLPPGSYELMTTKPGYINGAYGRRRHDGPSRSVQLSRGERATDLTILLWRPGTISGVIVDEAGEPMVSAPVRAYRRTVVNGRSVLELTGPSQGTDDRGSYRLANLEPGEYLVAVPAAGGSAPTSLVEAYRAGGSTNDPARRELSATISATGLSAASGGNVTRVGGRVVALPRGLAPPTGDGLPSVVYPTTYYPAATAAREATMIALRSGEVKAGIDISMRPVPAVKVSGTVLRPDGPAAHFVVELETPEHPASSFASNNIAPVTATDPSGAFLFPAVPAGTYTLRVTRMPASPAERSSSITTVVQGGNTMVSTVVGSSAFTTTTPLPTDPTWWAVLSLQVGRRDITDLQVPLQEGVRFAGHMEFDGTQPRPDEERVRRTSIVVMPADGSYMSGNRGAYVEADGRFKTIGVPGGRYILRVNDQVSGWTFKSAMYQGRDISGAPIEVSSSDLQGIVLTFTDRPASLAGTVRGGAGPDADASVVLFAVDSALWNASAGPRRPRIVRVTKDGGFSFTDLPPGTYQVFAIPDELASDWNDPRFLEAYARDATRVDLEEGGKKTQDLRTVSSRKTP